MRFESLAAGEAMERHSVWADEAASRTIMVIALEPAVYLEGSWGMRLEYVVRVTGNSCVTLSMFQRSLLRYRSSADE